MAPLTVGVVGHSFVGARLRTLAGVIVMVHQFSGCCGAFLGAWFFDNRGSYDDAFKLMLSLSLVAVTLTYMVRERPLPGVLTSSPPG